MENLPTDHPRSCAIMGVSGSGKTTIGAAVSAKLDWVLLEADDFHPQANIDKMSQGNPLNDEDRWPWLEAIHQAMAEHLSQGRSVVVVCCSALSMFILPCIYFFIPTTPHSSPTILGYLSSTRHRLCIGGFSNLRCAEVLNLATLTNCFFVVVFVVVVGDSTFAH